MANTDRLDFQFLKNVSEERCEECFCPHKTRNYSANTVSTLDVSDAKWQKSTEPIIISHTVYTGCSATWHISTVNWTASFYFWRTPCTYATSDTKNNRICNGHFDMSSVDGLWILLCDNDHAQCRHGVRCSVLMTMWLLGLKVSIWYSGAFGKNRSWNCLRPIHTAPTDQCGQSPDYSTSLCGLR